MSASGIPWCDRTWNPFVGCAPVSAGCARCWAARLVSRFPGHWTDAAVAEHGRWTGARIMRWAKSEDPRVWRRPATVFVGALGDLFGMAYGEIHAVLRTVAQCDWHRFLLLTKRPERAASWIRENHNDCWAHHLPWPFAHVYLGVSVEDQATADARVTALAALPACHRWVSAEPLLGPIAMGVPWMRAVEWVVAGGENGPGARPCDPDWLRSLRDQCAARSIAFYLKGLGKGDKEGVLDGRTHREFPPGLRKPVEVPA